MNRIFLLLIVMVGLWGGLAIAADSLNVSLVLLPVQGRMVRQGTGNEIAFRVERDAYVSWDFASPEQPVARDTISLPTHAETAYFNDEALLPGGYFIKSVGEITYGGEPGFPNNYYCNWIDVVSPGDDGERWSHFEEDAGERMYTGGQIRCHNGKIYIASLMGLTIFDMEMMQYHSYWQLPVSFAFYGDYLIMGYFWGGCGVLDMTYLPDSLHLVSGGQNFDSESRYAMAVQGNYLYSSHSSDYRSILVERIGRDFELEEVATISIPDSIQNLSVRNFCLFNDYLAVSFYRTVEVSEDDGLMIWDVQNPAEPDIVGYYIGKRFSALTKTDHGDLFACSEEGNWRVEFTSERSVSEEPPIPKLLSLTAYPNPFNSSITIKYSSDQKAQSFLQITDHNGRELLSRSFNSSSGYWTWNAMEVPAGTYFILIQSRDGVVSKPVTLLK